MIDEGVRCTIHNVGGYTDKTRRIDIEASVAQGGNNSAQRPK